MCPQACRLLRPVSYTHLQRGERCLDCLADKPIQKRTAGQAGSFLADSCPCLLYTSYIIFEYLQEKVRPPMEEEADMQVLLEKQKSEAERAKD